MKIITQSVFDKWPLEDNSIQAIITSPPYYSLRKYDIKDVIIGGDKDCEHEFILKNIIKKTNYNEGFNERWGNSKGTGKQEVKSHLEYTNGFCIHCNAWKGQYGLEPTPQMYIDHTRLWAKEAWRVLKNDGIFFLNIADSYNGNKKGNDDKKNMPVNTKYFEKIKAYGIPSKCQLLIPHRIALALVNDGWTLRNTIIWYKNNAMPESVTDRFSKKYEYIFMLTKQDKYYFDLDSVRKSTAESTLLRIASFKKNNEKYDSQRHKGGSKEEGQSGMQVLQNISKSNLFLKGSNPGDTWIYENDTLPGEEKLVNFVVEWEERNKTKISDENLMAIIKFWFPDKTETELGDFWKIATQPSSEKHYAMWPEKLTERMIKCSTKSGNTILDPFCGSGTTLKIAKQLHRKGIGIDLGYTDIQSKKLDNIQSTFFPH